MRRLFIVLILGLLAAVALVALIETSPGYVLVSWGKLTLETSLWVGLILLAAVFFLFYIVARLIRRVRQGGGTLASWFALRRESRGRRLTEAGMLSFAGGNWEMARRKLLRAVPHQSDPTLNYLAAARASNKMGDSAQVRQYLDAALTVSGVSDTVAITRAELLLENGDALAALADLDSLRRRERRFPQTLLLKLRAYEALGRWQDLLDLLPRIRKQQLLDDAAIDDFEYRAHSALLAEAADSADAGALKAAWFHVPETLKTDPRVLRQHVPQLISRGDAAGAEKLLTAALKRDWSPRLVALYGQLPSDNPSRQLKLAESWLKLHPQDADLLVCLGRLSLRCELWGRARDYFESAVSIRADSEACAELARLLFNLGEREKSAQVYRRGLMEVHQELPQLPQPGMAQSRA